MQLDRAVKDDREEQNEEWELLEDRFFSTPPPSLSPFEIDPPLDPGPPLPRSSQLAMVVTMTMLATAALVVPLTLVYSKSLVGAHGMLSHKGPELPDEATYRAATSARPIYAAGAPATTPAADAPRDRQAPPQASDPEIAQAELPAAAPEPESVALAEDSTAASIQESAVPGDEPDAVGPTDPEPVAAEPGTVPPTDPGTVAAPRPRATKTRAPRRTTPATRSAAAVERAFALFNAGEFEAAERAARRAANAHPTRADAWLILGATRDALGDHRGAVAAYNICSVRAEGPAAMDCQRLARSN